MSQITRTTERKTIRKYLRRSETENWLPQAEMKNRNNPFTHFVIRQTGSFKTEIQF